jgi:hypothetical protein
MFPCHQREESSVANVQAPPQGCPPPPGLKRYLTLYSGSLVLLMLAVALNEGWLGWEAAPHSLSRYGAALLPALPMTAIIGLQIFPGIASEDEFLRLVQVRAALVALGATLVVVSAWAFLTKFADVPPIPPMTILFLLIGLGGPGQAFALWKYR